MRELIAIVIPLMVVGGALAAAGFIGAYRNKRGRKADLYGIAMITGFVIAVMASLLGTWTS